MSNYNRPMLDAIINRSIASSTFDVLMYAESAAKWAAKGDASMADYAKRMSAEHTDKLTWLFSKLVCANKDELPMNHVQHMLMYAGSKKYRNADHCKEVVDCFVS